MKLRPADPDVRTIFERIRRGELDLQPDFQRNEVWSAAKKRKLIDSILRNWHVPPIHIVVLHDGRQEVLDGQQRLVSVRDFLDDELTVDGHVEPFSDEISALDGLVFSQLPLKFQRRVEGFTLRVYYLEDYGPSEPGELFFRLNQPAALTSAEQRNAFFGPVREQVRELVRMAESNGLSRETVGLGNSRMAYDDVVARFCCAIEGDGIWDKVSASQISDRYRRGEKFLDSTLDVARSAMDMLTLSAASSAFPTVRLNKASLHSWLLFCVNLQRGREVEARLADMRSFNIFLHTFEFNRQAVAVDIGGPSLGFKDKPIADKAAALFTDRVSSRAFDVSSAVLRDVALWSAASVHSSGIANWTFEISPTLRTNVECFHATLASMQDVLREQGKLLDIARELRWQM